MKVFDVSDCQGADVWEGIMAEAADGVIIKIGETLNGEQTIDDMFVSHVNNAVTNGVKFGVYYVTHAHSDEEAKAEAQYINDRVYEYLNGKEPELGVWLDAEVSSIKSTDTHGYLITCINQLTDSGFKKVGIYAGYSFICDYLNIEDLAEKQIPLWVANYGSRNYLKEEHPELNHTAWQYTECYSDDLKIDADIFFE